jgi:hypothetical protein
MGVMEFVHEIILFAKYYPNGTCVKTIPPLPIGLPQMPFKSE